MSIRARKSQHIRIAAEEDVSHRGTTLLECVHLVHHALPELDLDEIDMSTELMGKRLRFPLMICSMTGGAEISGEMNRTLAEVAARQGIAFALGSQRVMLRHPEVAGDFAVRPIIGDGLLLGNLGASHLEEFSPEVIAGAVDAIEADGICIHLNAAQELVQPEGQRRFRGQIDGIARLIDRLGDRVLVKETGAGLSPAALRDLIRIGVTCIDVAGAGGTSWTRVEMHRAGTEEGRRLAETFGDWGVPTALSVIAARRLRDAKCRIVGSGGIENGLDAARAIAAGAHIAGFARPILWAFLESGLEGACAFVDAMQQELRGAMLLCGADDLEALRKVPRVYSGELRNWLEAYGWKHEDGQQEGRERG